MDTKLTKAEWLEFHAAACADALRRFPDAHPDIKQYLGLVVLGEYPTDTPHLLYRLVTTSATNWVICSSRENYKFVEAAAINYCRNVLTHNELPDELKAYYERARH